MLIKTSAVSLVILVIHSQIRPLQDLHDLMCRCQPVGRGPIYMGKHSVALCADLLDSHSAQFNVHVK